MKTIFQKSFFLSLFLLLLTGCVSKKNGKYQTHYSYHPYYDLYAQKMSKKSPSDKIKRYEKTVKTSSTKKNRYPNQ